MNYQAISAATRRICDQNGYGHQVVVWSDGSITEATTGRDQTGRTSGAGIEYPLARFAFPSSAALVEEEIAKLLAMSEAGSRRSTAGE